MPLRHQHRRARPYRVAGYSVLAVVVAARSLEQHDPWLWPVVAVCLVWPFWAWRLESRARHPVRRTLQHHCGEAGALGALWALFGLWTPAALAVAVAAGCGLSAQAGPALLRGGSAVFLLGGLLGTLVAGLPPAPPPSDALGALLLLGFAAAVGLSGFHGVQRQHRRKVTEGRSARRARAASARLSAYLPEAARSSTSSAGRLSRRCWVTVVFADLSAFTSLCLRLQPEETERLVNGFATLAVQLSAARGGTLIRLLGDGALVAFGTGGASLERPATVRAALAFARRLSATTPRALVPPLGPPVRLRAGVASGFCTLGDWGPPERLEFTLIGPAVNLAARLQQAAPADGLLIDAHSGRLAGLDPARCPPRTLQLAGFGAVAAMQLGG